MGDLEQGNQPTGDEAKPVLGYGLGGADKQPRVLGDVVALVLSLSPVASCFVLSANNFSLETSNVVILCTPLMAAAALITLWLNSSSIPLFPVIRQAALLIAMLSLVGAVGWVVHAFFNP